MSVCELHGQIIGLFILIVTASDTACALAILVSYFLADFELTVSYQRIVKHEANTLKGKGMKINVSAVSSHHPCSSDGP